MISDSIEDHEGLALFRSRIAWVPYPPPEILEPEEDVGPPLDTEMDDLGGGKNIKKKNKTIKDKIKKYETKKKNKELNKN